AEIFRQLLSDSDNQFRLSRRGIFQVANSEPWAALDFVYKEMLSDRKTQREGLYSIARERIKSLLSDVEKLAETAPDSLVRKAAKAALINLNSPTVNP
ncbi:MAG: hypothetical protein AAF975_06935, partial [Spirochaetota bacterium]